MINYVIIDELKAKFGNVMNSFDNYKKFMFKLGSQVSGEISALRGYSYSLVEEANGLKFIRKETNLIDLIRQYNNIIVSLLENDAYEEEYSLLTFGELENNSRKLILQNEKTEINSNTKDMLLLILMYPFIHDGLKQTSHLIEKLFDSSLSNIENYLIIFYVILLVLHFFLLFICIIFLLSYTKMMKINIFSSNQLFSDKKFLELQNKRIEQIKIMNNLYSEHPLKIAEKIDLIDDIYRKKTREDSTPIKNLKVLTGAESINVNDEKTSGDLKSKNSENISVSASKNSQMKLKNNLAPKEDAFLKADPVKTLNVMKSLNSIQDPTNKINAKKNTNNNEEQISNTNYDEIISKNVKLSNKQFKKVINREIYILSFTFGFFYIFNIIFFVFVYKAKSQMNVLIEYCDINNSIDGYLFDNINSLIYLYVTNSTSVFYGQLIDENSNIDYIQDGINTLYDAVRKKDIIEREHSNIFPQLGDVINLNCTDEILPDEYFEKSLGSYETYEEYYKAICQMLPVASSGSDTNIIMEILYSVEFMYQKFMPRDDFKEIYRLYVNQTKHYSIYTLVLTISRIIRTYYNENIFSKEVNNVFNSFSTIFIVYLVLSVIFEVFIFFVLNFGIISDVRKTNKLLLDFMSSLRF